MNRMYEELALNAWPALTTHHYDGWLLKYANGYTKRANSVYPIYDSTLDFDSKIEFCEAYYSRRGLEATFKMNDSDSLRTLDMHLEDRGYHVLDPTEVMIMNLGSFEAPDDVYDTQIGYSEVWSEVYADLIGITGDDDKSQMARETIKQMLGRITQKSLFVTFREADEAVAIGYGVIERGQLGVFNIIVKEDFRGKGYGSRVMKAVLGEGKKLGATDSYLQVVCANEVAVNLYRKFGYEKLYTYWYRRK